MGILSVTWVSAQSFDLDFSGASVFYNSTAETLRMEFEDVAVGVGAPDIDVVIQSINRYEPDTDTKGEQIPTGNNGTPAGTDDFKIHLDRGTDTQFTFTLYDGANGLFDTLYNPGTSYSYGLVAYDIDGGLGDNYDVLRIYSPVTYTLSPTTTINVSLTEQYVEFSGEGAGEVDGQDGLTSFTTAQENAAVDLQFNNLNSFTFEYLIPVTNDGTGRNQLFDGNNLTVDGTPIVVPEPWFLGFLSTGLLLAVAVAFRRR